MAEDLFNHALNAALRKRNITYNLKTLQKECIQSVLEHKDVFGMLPTGYGKSLIYTVLPDLFFIHQQLSIVSNITPVLERDTSIIIVISPLVSLMKDQEIAFNTMGIDCAYLGDMDDKGKYMYALLPQTRPPPKKNPHQPINKSLFTVSYTN